MYVFSPAGMGPVVVVAQPIAETRKTEITANLAVIMRIDLIHE